MQKILNLYRLDSANRNIVLKYLLKRVFKGTTTLAEKFVNEYYFHLIRFNGILEEETGKSYFTKYKDLGISARLRKRPSSDMDVFRDIYLVKAYKPVADAYIKNFKFDGNLNIIDAGANIGLTTIFLSQIFAKARFICIEPDSANFDSLTFNLEANGISNVEKIKGGIWSKNAHLKIVNDFRDKNDWAFRVEETMDNTGLEAFSISYLANKYKMETIDILKIDIEGSEKEIFGDYSDQSFLAQTKCIAIEIHDEFDCRDRIYKVLQQYGFAYFEADDLTIGINQNLL